MRLLITKGPNADKVLDLGTRQAERALSEGWAVMPFPAGEPALLHADQVIPVVAVDAVKEPSPGQPRLNPDLIAPFVKPRGRR